MVEVQKPPFAREAFAAVLALIAGNDISHIRLPGHFPHRDLVIVKESFYIDIETISVRSKHTGKKTEARKIVRAFIGRGCVFFDAADIDLNFRIEVPLCIRHNRSSRD